MPNQYITYLLAALSLGLSIAFLRVSDENSALQQARVAMEMKLQTVEGEAKAFRQKYATEVKAREFAEAAQILAETSERAVRVELAHETEARQAAEKSLEEAQTARASMEAALSEAQAQVGQLNAKLLEASAAKEQSERKPDAASDAAAGAKEQTAPSADASPAAPAASTMTAQASMGGGRSWFSFFGLF